MKKASSKKRDSTDELRAEYDFDYSKARPNPYAALLKGRAVAVVLDPDVAEAFPTSESVNTVLRSGVAAVVRQVVSSAEETRSLNERNTDLIRRRAHLVKASHPDLTELIDEYVARQEHETQLLGTDLICAIWVLRRV